LEASREGQRTICGDRLPDQGNYELACFNSHVHGLRFMPKVAEIGAILYDFISVGGQQIFICIGGSATTSVGRMVVQSNRGEYL